MQERDCVNCDEKIIFECCPPYGSYYYHVRENPTGSIYCVDPDSFKKLPTEQLQADPKGDTWAIDYEVWKLENDER